MQAYFPKQQLVIKPNLPVGRVKRPIVCTASSFVPNNLV